MPNYLQKTQNNIYMYLQTHPWLEEDINNLLVNGKATAYLQISNSIESLKKILKEQEDIFKIFVLGLKNYIKNKI